VLVWLPQTLLELLTRPNTSYLLHRESAHCICVGMAMLYSNVFFVTGRRAVIALLVIRRYVAGLNVCGTMVSFSCIILYN
jgi:hypothetical protein